MKLCRTLLTAAMAALLFVPVLRAQDCVVLECPPDVFVECAGGEGTPVLFNVSAFSRCASNVTTVCTPPSGSLFPLGRTRVFAVATDALGNSNTCNFSVVVQDTAAPSLLCPDLLVVPCQSPDGAVVEFAGSASDTCDPNPQIIYSPPSGSLFPLGTNLVLCVARDVSGNQAETTFPLIVTEGCVADDCVSIFCPTSLVTNASGQEGTVVTFSVGATNRCGGTVTVTTEPRSGSVFPVGLTTVLCTARGERTGLAQCAFTVEVIDRVPPTINCPSNIVVRAQGPDGAVVNWSTSATDDASPTVSIRCDPPSGTLFPLGDSVVRCFAIDGAGNVGLCGFQVTVTPQQLEVIPLRRSEALLRWTGNGTPEETPVLGPLARWERVQQPINRDGDEQTMVYPLQPAQRFFRLAAAPLVPPPDEDADGVPDSTDRCPGTAVGSVVDACGCAALQLTTRPERLLGAVHQRLQEVVDGMRPADVLTDTVAGVLSALAEMNLAGAEIRAGEFGDGRVTVGADRYSAAVGFLEATYAQLLDTIAVIDRLRPPIPWPPVEDGDVSPEELNVSRYRTQARLLQEAITEAQAANRSLTWLKNSVTERASLRAQVLEINDAERSLRLDDGTQVALLDKAYPDIIQPGTWVLIDALKFPDGTAAAENLAAVPGGPPISEGLLNMRCLELRVAPAQNLLPTSQGPYLLHRPEAYAYGGSPKTGVLHLEQGMGLAVVSGGCGLQTGAGKFLFYRAKLDLKYHQIGAGVKLSTLAASLADGQPPVTLPSGIDPSYNAILTVTISRRECQFPMPGDLYCSAPEVVSVDTYTLYVRPQFSYARARYSQTLFALDGLDGEYHLNDANFGTAQVTNVQLLSSALASAPDVTQTLTFTGQGYSVNDGKSSLPNLKTIGLGQAFAVHKEDTWAPDKVSAGNQFFYKQVYGVTIPSGLIWPRATGTHNGHAFAYSCELPPLVRDGISLCSGVSNTFYRLPFVAGDGWPEWTVTQGNNGSFSHQGVFAYDFAADQGTAIHAARGGIVVDLLESSNQQQENMSTCVVPGNYVKIRHQDGTIGVYYHMVQNGVLVELNQKVRRGDLIAKVGTTGCSTGPHLHFQVDAGLSQPSIGSRFEVLVFKEGQFYPPEPPSLTLHQCFLPAKGNYLISTNVK